MPAVKRTIAVFFAAFLLITFSGNVYAETDISLGFERMSGETWYQIGGMVTYPFAIDQVHFPISELRFPLDVYLISIGASTTFKKKFTAVAGLSTNITSDAGTAEDSDWGYHFLQTGEPFFSQRSLDVFSTSDAELTAITFDARLRYSFYSNSSFSLGAGIGYRHRNFEFELSNLDQWYPSSPIYFGFDWAHDRVRGKVGSYEITYTIPFAEIVGNLMISKKFNLEASLGYAPYAGAEDDDDHSLRFIRAKTDAEGTAWLFSLAGRYEITRQWFATLKIDYMKVEADGTEYNIIYAGPDAGTTWTIDHQIESEQSTVSIAVGYSF